MRYSDIIREGAIPNMIFHGTSDVCWELIRKENVMLPMESNHADWEPAVCFTRSYEVAEWFAGEAVQRDEIDGAKRGVVIRFDGKKMAQRFGSGLSDYHDHTMTGDWDEAEVRVGTEELTGVNDLIIGVDYISEFKPRPQ